MRFNLFNVFVKTHVLEMQGIGSIHLEIDVYFGMEKLNDTICNDNYSSCNYLRRFRLFLDYRSISRPDKDCYLFREGKRSEN